MRSATVTLGHTPDANLTRSAHSSSGVLETERQASPAIHDATLGSHDAARQGAVRAALEDALRTAVACSDFVTVASLAKVLADMGDKPADARERGGRLKNERCSRHSSHLASKSSATK